MSLKKTRRLHAQKSAQQAVEIARHITEVAQHLANPTRITALDAALEEPLAPSVRSALQTLRDEFATLNGLPTKYTTAV